MYHLRRKAIASFHLSATNRPPQNGHPIHVTPHRSPTHHWPCHIGCLGRSSPWGGPVAEERLCVYVCVCVCVFLSKHANTWDVFQDVLWLNRWNFTAKVIVLIARISSRTRGQEYIWRIGSISGVGRSEPKAPAQTHRPRVSGGSRQREINKHGVRFPSTQ